MFAFTYSPTKALELHVSIFLCTPCETTPALQEFHPVTTVDLPLRIVSFIRFYPPVNPDEVRGISFGSTVHAVVAGTTAAII